MGFLSKLLGSIHDAAQSHKDIRYDNKEFIHYEKKKNTTISDKERFNSNSINKSLKFISQGVCTNENFQYIPKEVLELLWFADGYYKNFDNEDQFTNDGIVYIKIPEPSLISLNLPVGEIIKNPENIDYFPRYAALQPDERATYLNWLKNIDETIPIGFVFIFYYGLERFLFTQEDKFEKAFNMILRLRRHHKNHSFQAYSYDTLLFACIYRQHWELFNELFKDKQFLSPLTLACMAQTGKQLFPEDILNLASAVGFKNKRYIKNEPKLFLQVLGEILREKYASSGYPLSKISIIDCPRKSVCPVIANTSLRFMPYHVPNLLENALFKRDLLEILNSTHEKVKLLLRQQRTKK